MAKAKEKKKKNQQEFRQLAEVDRIIHEPARLLIVSFLYVVDSADFLFLLNQTGLTRGNLSSHLIKLEEAGYVEIRKEFLKKTPRTLLVLTKKGRHAFIQYRKRIRQVFDDLPE